MSLAAVLLAGGRSTRMGRDKALLDWRGRPLWQVQLDKLRALQPERLLLSCRREQSFRPDAGTEVVHDEEQADDGPLGAITRCLEIVQMPLLVLAVDMPWMTPEFLRENLQPGRFYHGAHGFEALAAVYVPAMLPVMRRALQERQLVLQRVIDECLQAGFANGFEMDAATAAFFRNANTPEEWAS
ncbi:MAG: molybdenum cofactor guanylyltransferase [Prosthecobacter sp.]